MRALVTLLVLSSCGSAEERRADVLARAESARAVGELDLAEQILFAARRRGEDPVISMRLAEFLEKRSRNAEARAIVRTLPQGEAQLRARGRLAATFRDEDDAIDAVANLYRRGRATHPDVRLIIHRLGLRGERLPYLEQLAMELDAEGDDALLRSWIAELPADHPSRLYLPRTPRVQMDRVQ